MCLDTCTIYIYILYSRCENITLISNNCIAGFVYHDIRMQFNSPTINLQIAPSDYVKFVNNMDEYLSKDLIEITEPNVECFKKLGGGGINFPVGKLGDIVIYFQHYKSFEVAKHKWEDRKKRIDKNKIVLLLVDTFCSREVLDLYSNAPYKKVFLSNDNNKADWFENGTFLHYNSEVCTEWHEKAKGIFGFSDVWGRRYFEKTKIFDSIFK